MQVTIGITSHNRGLYLGALLASIKDEVRLGGHQVVVVDNSSTEDEVFDACERHREIIDQMHTRHEFDWINDEYVAKNVIIEEAKHDVILFLQDDMQNVGWPGSVSEHADLLYSSVSHLLNVNPMRRSTVDRTVGRDSLRKNHLVAWFQRECHLGTTGYFRKSTLERLGPYPTDWPMKKSYWGASEDWYDAEFKSKIGNVAHLVAHIPTFLPVWNDPRGGYAFNRDGRRWGFYQAPSDPSGLYYEHLTNEFAVRIAKERLVPLSFVDVARPLGWSLALDETGDTKKYSQQLIMEEG